MEKIITKTLSAIEWRELVDFIKNRLDESIQTNLENYNWYKDCSMIDYFDCWDDLYNENGEFVGTGLDVISTLVVYNEDTEEDFQSAFEQAKKEALEEVYVSADYNKERVYAYGFGETDNSRCDAESAMQDFVDKDDPERWEVRDTQYFPEDGCWAARIIEISE